MLQLHLPYPITLILGGIVGGLWCVLFGLPSARVKGFYLIMTTMAAQFITVEFFITQYVSQIGGRGVAFSHPARNHQDRAMGHSIGYGSLLPDGRSWWSSAPWSWPICFDRRSAGPGSPSGTTILLQKRWESTSIYYKLLAFFVAGFFGGIAGAFWVTSLAAISPEHFQFGWSLWLVGVILIGGVGSLHGTIFGAMFMTLIPEGLKFLIFILTQNPFFVNLMPFLASSSGEISLC